MKYENAEEAITLIEKIRKQEEILSKVISKPKVTLIGEIHHDPITIMTIGTDEGCEHPYHRFASQMIQEIIVSIQFDIQKMKRDLSLL